MLFAEKQILDNPFPGKVISPFGVGVLNGGGVVNTGVSFFC